jgi:hypothetical protein
VAALPVVSFVKNGRRISVVTISHAERFVPEYEYSLEIPPGAFVDLAGNAFAGVLATDYKLTATVEKDESVPLILAVDLGAGGSPNPAFQGDSITLYFSESVQRGFEGSVMLRASSGGLLCSSDISGSCEPGQTTCSSACGYKEASVDMILNVLSIDGNTVVVGGGFGMLELDGGYSLLVEEGAFQDRNANHNPPIDGEAAEHGYVFRYMRGSSQTLALVDLWPEPGMLSTPPSTALLAKFSSAVRAGSGDISIGWRQHPASSCHFQGASMFCIPPVALFEAERYTAWNMANAVVGAVGQIAPTVDWMFTTTDVDYTAPYLLEANWASSAVVPKAALITLVFSEVVQMGVGNVGLADCTPGVPDLCYDGALEPIADAHIMTSDLKSPDLKIYFEGTIVYIDHPDLGPGVRYSLTTDVSGVFQDVAGNPFFKLERGLEFTVASEDKTGPLLYQRVPAGDLSASATGASPNADIMLYFSEAVQVGQSASTVTVSDGETVSIIPIDNSEPSQGTVSVSGNLVTIDPFRDMRYNRVVSVQVESGSFADLSGQPFLAGTRLQFKTVGFEFVQMRQSADNAFDLRGGFPGREGAVLYHNGSSLVLFGGKRGNDCLDDLWTSRRGMTWKKYDFSAEYAMGETRPKMAHAPTAVDAQGCLWLLGGECNEDTGTILKTCDGGITWLPIPPPRYGASYT